jgi:hypothetical protein
MDFGLFTYTYATSFTISGSVDPGQQLTGVWWADGNMRASCGIMLNATCVDSTSSDLAYAGPGIAFTFSSGFLSGANTLQFFVNNSYRETGLRAHLTATDTGIPEPGTLALVGAGLLVLAIRRRR